MLVQCTFHRGHSMHGMRSFSLREMHVNLLLASQCIKYEMSVRYFELVTWHHDGQTLFFSGHMVQHMGKDRFHAFWLMPTRQGRFAASQELWLAREG